jgi:hypothetical protein
MKMITRTQPLALLSLVFFEVWSCSDWHLNPPNNQSLFKPIPVEMTSWYAARASCQSFNTRGYSDLLIVQSADANDYIRSVLQSLGTCSAPNKLVGLEFIRLIKMMNLMETGVI